MWRVQAVKGNVLSSWTPWQKVALSGTTEGVCSVFAPTPAIAANEMVDVYTACGQHVGRTSYANFQSQPTYTGVYLLRITNGKVVKVVK